MDFTYTASLKPTAIKIMFLEKISQGQERSRIRDVMQRIWSSRICVKEVKYTFFFLNPQGLESDLTTKYHSLQTNFCREMLFFGSI